MPGPKEPNVIDGFSSIRAVRRADESGHSRRFKTRPSQDRVPGPDREPGQKKKDAAPASRIGHTVVPKKHELLCYECGYAFVIQGVIHYPICPKCHRTLIKDDLSIDNEWTGDVKTIGNVEIKSTGVITSGSITARDILIEGNAEQCVLHVGRRLELGHGARFDPAKTEFKDARIRPDARIKILHKFFCRNLTVEGELTATVFASGSVSVKSGGALLGSLNTARLTVEDGGGLKARLRVETGAGDTTTKPEQESTHKREKQHGDTTRIGPRSGRTHQ